MENLKPLFHTILSMPINLLQFCLMFLCLFHNIFQSSRADTLYANQSLSGDQTLISSGGIFELGFFKPGTSSPYYYVGIWYKKITPQTVVWVANRNRPVSDKYSAVLKVVEDGNLVLLDGSKVQIWSTNVSFTFPNSVHAVLLDNGNFMLKDDPKLDKNSVIPIWQSFDYPTHTFLPGSKISFNKRTKAQQIITSWKNSEDPSTGFFSIELDANESQFLLKWSRSEQYWTSGPWDGEGFSSQPEMKLHYIFNYSYVSNENESYFTYSLISPSVISRLVLDVSGQVQQLTWLENTKQWAEFWVRPQKICQIYGVCGPFGSCNDSSLFCSCPDGFMPRSESDWNLGGFSGGCTRETNLDCQNFSAGTRSNAGFLERGWNLRNLSSDQPSRTQYLPINVANEAECKSACLNDCTCTVYTYLSDVCFIWKDEILNLLQQSEDDDVGARKVYLKVAASDLSHGLVSKSSNGKLAAGIISGIVILVVLSLSSSGCIFYKKRVRGGQGRREEDQESSVFQLYESAKGVSDVADPRQLRKNETKGIEVPFFEFETVAAATGNFSEANKLGQGGFGPVYKGKLPEGVEIAVKRLSSHSGQGVQEFKNEVSLIAKLQHRNLVRLLGYSLKGDEMILLYEYMPNKSLDHFIFDRFPSMVLNWTKRLDIILGIARGLLYLHQDSRLRIIHRDLKTSNILLDEEMNPKISDFGLAKTVQGRELEATTKRVIGTYGYMAPEYALDGLFSVKSDVFGFGVVVLEIISGKKNTGFYQSEQALSLLGYAWHLWKERKPLELMDQVIAESCNSDDVLKCITIGLLCVQDDPSDRPSMSNVVLMLSSNTNLPDPKQPAFVARRGVHGFSSSSNSSAPQPCSNNELTITMQEGR